MPMVNQALLLRTKLHRPQHEDDIVPRPRLLARLDEGVRRPLTLISAPAGFGKSTLLSAWLAQCALPSTWLSLDAGDNDLLVFLNYLIAAIRVLEPDACAETEALASLAAPVAESVLAHQLINELDALPDNFVLVLDDYDQIDHPAIHELVSILVRRPPRPLRLVIAARQDPPLPLVKLRAKGLLTEVRMGELRFQAEETAAFWRSRSEYPLDAASAATLDRVVEGWPVGLQLAAISLRLSTDPAQTITALASSHTHVMDYLFHEIFETLPAGHQDCLLKIALLDRFCGSLCAASVRRSQSQNQRLLDSRSSNGSPRRISSWCRWTMRASGIDFTTCFCSCCANSSARFWMPRFWPRSTFAPPIGSPMQG